MKTWFTLLLVACSFSVASASTPEMEEQLAFVKKMYAEHQQSKGLFLDERRRSEWPKVFSSELVKVLKKERGFDPLFFAQDFEVKQLRITPVYQGSNGQGLILVTFRNFGELVQLMVACNREGFGFRIENIVQPSTGVDLLNDLAND